LYENNNISYFFFVQFNCAKAASVYDFQIENLITDYLNLIQEINEVDKKIKFSIILDENPNAFINEEKILFITTGLLKYTPNYEALIGVLAHEVGHLDSYHVTKRIKSIKNLQVINQFSTLSLIASSILVKNADYLVQSMAVNQVGINNYYSGFSKEQEREADIYAIQTLNKLRLSSTPLKQFLKILEKNSLKKNFNTDNYMFSSHPVYEERFNILENETINQQIMFNQQLNNRFNFIKAKLFGFTENENHTLNDYLENDYYEYANSIILSRNGKLKESLIILNKLINKYPANIFLIETKADLLMRHGYMEEAMKFYQKVYFKEKANNYVKKKIFEIKYEKNNKKDNKVTQKFFNEYSDLLIIFIDDIMLYNKFNKMASILKKNEWIDFTNTNNLLKNNLNKKAIQKLNNILITSQDQELIYFTKQKIRHIANE